MEYLALLLVVAACPIMMGVMMWMMRRNNQPAPPTQPAQPDPNTQEEIAILRAEIATLRASTDPPHRSEDRPA
jgi:uncharacterized iron-regulated membrane protein